MFSVGSPWGLAKAPASQERRGAGERVSGIAWPGVWLPALPSLGGGWGEGLQHRLWLRPREAGPATGAGPGGWGSLGQQTGGSRREEAAALGMELLAF